MYPNILIIGQSKTSRTETFRDYFEARSSYVETFCCGGIRQMRSGEVTRTFEGDRVSSESLWHFASQNEAPSLLIPYFLGQIFRTFTKSLSSPFLRRGRFDLAIGISPIYAVTCIILKKLGIVRQVGYYCIDYYPKPTGMVSRLIYSVFRMVDLICVNQSDYVWDLTSAITSLRLQSFGQKVQKEPTVLPLTYSSKMLNDCPEVPSGHSIVYVGTLEKLTGLDLTIDTAPTIVKTFPDFRCHIIGNGPYRKPLIDHIRSLHMENYFTFYGFVEDAGAFDIMSRCRAGLATYIPSGENNVMVADPGKPKLYAFRALPAIVTKYRAGLQLAASGAGIAIEYDKESLAEAITRLFESDVLVREMQQKARAYAKRFVTEDVFDSVLTNSRYTSRGERHQN